MKALAIRARHKALLGLICLVSLVACAPLCIITKNSRPVANAGVDQSTAQVGQAVTLDGSASSDADGDSLTYSWALISFPGTTPPALFDPETAKPSFTPTLPGDYVAQLIVGDGKRNSDPDTARVTVNVAQGNHLPQITSTPVNTALVGQPYGYDVDATDPDSGDTLTYALTTAPSGMSINPGTGLIAWTPVAAGSFDVTIEVSDSKGGTARQPFSVTVVAVNQSPKVNAGADQTITLPATTNLNGDVTDDDLPSPPGAVTTHWSKQSGPGNVTFGNVSAVDTTAGFSEAGTYMLRLTAHDGELSASGVVTVTVKAASGGGGGLPPDPSTVAPRIDPTVANHHGCRHLLPLYRHQPHPDWRDRRHDQSGTRRRAPRPGAGQGK